MVCVAYGGEGYKSRLQVTRCQGGWPNGLESRLWPLPRQLIGAEANSVVCNDSHVSGHMAIDNLAGHSQRRFIRGKGLDGYCKIQRNE